MLHFGSTVNGWNLLITCSLILGAVGFVWWHIRRDRQLAMRAAHTEAVTQISREAQTLQHVEHRMDRIERTAAELRVRVRHMENFLPGYRPPPDEVRG